MGEILSRKCFSCIWRIFFKFALAAFFDYFNTSVTSWRTLSFRPTTFLSGNRSVEISNWFWDFLKPGNLFKSGDFSRGLGIFKIWRFLSQELGIFIPGDWGFLFPGIGDFFKFRDFYPGDWGFLKSGNFDPWGLGIFSKSGDFYPEDRGFFIPGIFWGWGFFGDGDFFTWDGISHQKATSEFQ